jgi:hypothetical protein
VASSTLFSDATQSENDDHLRLGKKEIIHNAKRGFVLKRIILPSSPLQSLVASAVDQGRGAGLASARGKLSIGPHSGDLRAWSSVHRWTIFNFPSESMHRTSASDNELLENVIFSMPRNACGRRFSMSFKAHKMVKAATEPYWKSRSEHLY